jgi:hypothetical protein
VLGSVVPTARREPLGIQLVFDAPTVAEAMARCPHADGRIPVWTCFMNATLLVVACQAARCQGSAGGTINDQAAEDPRGCVLCVRRDPGAGDVLRIERGITPGRLVASAHRSCIPTHPGSTG